MRGSVVGPLIRSVSPLIRSGAGHIGGDPQREREEALQRLIGTDIRLRDPLRDQPTGGLLNEYQRHTRNAAIGDRQADGQYQQQERGCGDDEAPAAREP